jgi:Flp pilus assembly protein CpaB
MRSRGLVVAIAVVLAVLAAVGVIVYTSNIRQNVAQENTTLVITSSQDIPPNTALDQYIDGNVFKQTAVPNDELVPSAVRTTDELRGKTSSAYIFQNEQIPLERVTGEVGVLGISEGNVGIRLQVDGAAAVNGYVQQGSSVVLYATFDKGTLVSRQTLKFFLKGSQISRLAQTVGSGSSNAALIAMPTDYTFQLVPSVKVIAVQNPPADTATGKPTAGSSTFVLDLTPSDAANVVFAVDHSTLYMGLLPTKNEAGYSQPGVIGAPFARVVGVNKG